MISDDVSEVLKKFKEAITPEMETPKMKGKGADLFARRRQRMEKFIITNENRNQKVDSAQPINRHADDNVGDPPEMNCMPPTPPFPLNDTFYVPPTPTTPSFTRNDSFYQPVPPRNIPSGYCTDMEDSRPSFHRNMKMNYFSDCEDIDDLDYERGGRKSRPINRRAWETDVEDAYQSEVETPTKTQMVFQFQNGNSMPAIRRVVPPETPSWSQVTRSPLSPMTPGTLSKSFTATGPPKRSWSRVTFCPKTPSQPRPKQHTPVQYPCARITARTGQDGIKNQPSPATKPSYFNPIFLDKRTNTGKAMNRPKTLTINKALPKIDERPIQHRANGSNQVKEQNVHPVPITKFTPARSAATHKSSATIIMNRKSNSRRPAKQNITVTQQGHALERHPKEIHSESLEIDNDETRRPGSSASVASYVSSNSSLVPSTIPSRCLTPTYRSHTPTGSPRILKIAGSKPTSPNRNEYSPTPFNTPTPLEQSNVMTTSPDADKSPADKKVSACLKVLDPTRSLSLPKSTPYQATPSPTLNAVLKQETAGSFNSTGARIHLPTETSWTNSAMLHCRPPSRSVNRAPQPLGSVAEGMKGKGARMFEKQQKRMHNYTRETSKESYPDLAYPNGPSLTSYQVGQSPHDVHIGMRDVVGEFQKNSQAGKPNPPSETTRRTRDPTHYQQPLHRPPSVDDFIGSPHDYLSNVCRELPAHFQMFPSASDFVGTPPSIPSPSDSRGTFGDDAVSTRSTSSVSSLKSIGPKTAPKPAKAVIQKQLSRESIDRIHAHDEVTNGDNLPCPDADKPSFQEAFANLQDQIPEITLDKSAIAHNDYTPPGL